MEQTKALRILLSIMLSIGFWLLFLLLLYVLAVYEYSFMVFMGLAILAVTADTIYEILEKNERR